MKKVLLLLVIVFCGKQIHAQITQDSLLYLAEEFILTDNASNLNASIFDELDRTENEYANLVYELIHAEKLDYRRHYQFLVWLREARPSMPYRRFNEFIEREVNPPLAKDKIELNYVKIIWTQISELSNLSLMEEAQKKNDALKEYILQFDAEDPDVLKAQIMGDYYQLVLYQIQREVEKGMDLALKNEEKARSVNDTDLIVSTLYQQSDFLIAEGKLLEYINVCEEGLRLDKMQKVRSNFYNSIISHLVDAYIYKGDQLDRVKELLEELERDIYFKTEAVSFYGKILGFANPEETEIQFILDRFEAEDVKEAAYKAVQETENVEDKNAFYYVLNEFAGALLNYGFKKDAKRFYNRAILVNRQIYSQELSKSLAENETNQIRKEKELAVAYEKKQTSLYALIAVLVGILSLISVFAFVRKRKQARLLAENKKELEKTLQEKQLLLKEVHHRVKNNFQIVSSLLELQSKGIEDEKARELASEGKNRIRSMALIHQKLYQNDELVIYFDEYIQNLVKEIREMYGEEKNAKVLVEVPSIAFDVDTAIPLGLIINELVTNSFKYGLNQLKGELAISMNKTAEEGTYVLAVKDNGKGMPEDFNFSKAKSLGLRLVKSLTKQLHGSVKYVNNEGAVFTIFFKDSITRSATE